MKEDWGERVLKLSHSIGEINTVLFHHVFLKQHDGHKPCSKYTAVLVLSYTVKVMQRDMGEGRHW